MDRSGRRGPILGSQAASSCGNLRWQSTRPTVEGIDDSFMWLVPIHSPLLNSDSDNDTVDCHVKTGCNFDEAIKPICFRMMALDPPQWTSR